MLSIGELARRTGVKIPTIRYYEQTGLIDPPDRTGGNQRRYGRDALRRLSFIRHARDLGFSVEAIRELIDLNRDPDRTCSEIDLIARDHLAEVEERIARLSALRAELKRMIAQCAGGKIAECSVMESIADHRHCRQKH